MSQHWNELKNGYNPQDILEILAIWEGRGVVLLFLWENVIEHLSAGQIGKIQKKNKNSYSKYIIFFLFSDLPHNNRPFEWNCVSHAPGRYDTHYHLTKIPKVGYCLLPAMRSRSRHFLPALMLASMLPFTIMHYMMLQINHNNCFASRLTEGCMSCTLKADVSILPAILMLTLMLIISSIKHVKALCFNYKNATVPLYRKLFVTYTMG